MQHSAGWRRYVTGILFSRTKLSYLGEHSEADGSLPNKCQFQQNVPQHYYLLDILVF